MTVNALTCEQFADSLSDFLERDADEPTRASTEAHALACVECASLLADVRRLAIDGAKLPGLSPSRDLWEGIAARIDAPVVPITGEAERGRRQIEGYRGRRHWVRLGAAAAALVVATAGVTYVATRSFMEQPQVVASNQVPAPTKAISMRPDTTPTVAPRRPLATTSGPREGLASVPAGAQARLASNRKRNAEATYDIEIARLRSIVDQRRTLLDPVTVGIVERNLKVIDDAISQCRIALQRDPASRFLMESLNSALEHKVELLRTAAMLPART